MHSTIIEIRDHKASMSQWATQRVALKATTT